MNRDHAKIAIEQALQKLLTNDLRPEMPDGFPRTIGERPLVFRLAHYMAECGVERDGLRLDCDYNRHGNTIKELLPPKEEPGMPGDMPLELKPKRFFPDIVLHRRGDDERNVFVCEVKRLGDHRGPDVDRDRLIQLTCRGGVFHYEVGAFVHIDQRAATISIEYFEAGRLTSRKMLA